MISANPLSPFMIYNTPILYVPDNSSPLGGDLLSEGRNARDTTLLSRLYARCGLADLTENVDMNTVKYFLCLATLILSLIFMIAVSSAAEDDFPLSNDDLRIRSSVNYLLTCQNPDGGFGDRPENSSDLLPTADVAMALFRTGDINLAVKDGKTPLDYLIEKRPQDNGVNAGDLGRYMMGVVAAGGNPHDIGGSDYVDLLKYRARQAPGTDPSAEAYALLGLVAVGETESTEAQAYVRHLKIKQLASGGWGKDSSSPDTNTTGLVICALIGAGEDVSAEWMVKALAWLESVQSDDGGFSALTSSPTRSSSPSTELAVMAILAAGKSPVEDPWRSGDADPIVYLLNCQKSGGEIWFEQETAGPAISEYTAFGVISLTGGWLPATMLAPSQAYAISVNKTANVSSAAAGDLILYTISVNNTGDAILDEVVAYDNLTKHQEKIGSLDPSKNHTFTTTYTVKEADIGKTIVNSVTASGIADGIVYRGFDNATVSTVYKSNIEVNKTANVSEVNKTGSVILYTIWVNNTGDTVLNGVVADDSLTKHKENLGSLDPGENCSFTTTYTVRAADLGTSIVNKVTARCTGPNGESYENSSTATVETVAPETVSMHLMVFNDGALVFNKTVDVVGVNPTSWDAIQQSGASYEYTDWGGSLGIFIDRLAGVGEKGWGPSFWHDGGFSEWGCSNWQLHEGEIDQWIGPNSPSHLASILYLGECPEKVDKGQVFKIKITEMPAYSSVYGGVPQPCDGATVTVGFDKYNTNSNGETPEISLNKDARYCVYATKTGYLATYWLGAKSPIDGASTITCGAGGPLICDLTGQKPPENPNIEVNKTADRDYADMGDVITYTVWVNNTGDAVLNEVVAKDGLTGDEEELGVLEAGVNKSFTITYTVTERDLGKDITNTVTVSGEDSEGESYENSSTATVATPRLPVKVQKIASPKGGLPLTEVRFIIAITASGDEDLRDVTVVDHLPTGLDYVSDNRSGTVAGDEITWNIGTLGRGESDFIELVAQIQSGASAILTNEVNVTAMNETEEVTHSDSEDVTVIETETLDFGDAPDSYSTLLAKNGARHVSITGFYLGYSIDDESDAWDSSDASGDNIHDLNDEDGVTITNLIPGETATINVRASDDGGYLNAWIDFGADGSWTDNIDQIFVNKPLKRGLNRLTFTVPSEAKEDSETFARFRFSAEKGLSFTGLAHDGEVEDYRLTIGTNPKVVVTKTADESEVDRGDEINYTICINNTLLDVPLHNVVVRDVFNKPVEFVSTSPTPDSDGVWKFSEIVAGTGKIITLRVRVPESQDFEFSMGHGVSGEGFVKVANDYSTSFESYTIENCVYVTSEETGDSVFSDCESVAVSGDPGTELSTREHGSGSYESEELVRMMTENKSISMENDMAATYKPTTLGLYNNRTIEYSSKWTEGTSANNRVTGASMSEYYQHATTIDRESRFDLDKNGTTMEFDTEFEGMGHIGVLQKPDPDSTVGSTPAFELQEDYTGSFRVIEKADEYGSSVTSEKSASGSGFVSADKRIKESQRSYEYGSGDYDSEEIITTSTNYIAKDISLEYRPSSFKIDEDTWSNQSLKWKEVIWSKTPETSFIGEEYTGIDRLDKDTVAKGLNEMNTEAEFSGTARLRTIMQSGSWSSGDGPIYISNIDLVDEWVEITNRGDESVNMIGWNLSDDDGNSWYFPYFVLHSEQSVKVHTFAGTNTSTDLYMGKTTSIWNDEGDCAILTDAGDNLVDEMCTGEDDDATYKIEIDDEYIGDYSIERHVLLEGVPKVDHPHLAVSKSGDLHYEGDKVFARYSITLENDGDRSLGPIYVEDIFPPGAEYVNSSIRPFELTSTSANWTLTHLAIGDISVIYLWLNVASYAGDDLVNRVEAGGAYNDTWVTATNFTALEIDWLACSLDRSVSVAKTAELDLSRSDVVRYTLTIKNLEGDSKVARVTDPLPDGMKLLDASVPPSSDDDGVLTWNLIDLGPFDTKTIVYDAEALWSGTFVNRAEVDVRSVNGTSVPIQYASAIIDVGVSDEQESAPGWQPPDWGFNTTSCEDCELGD